MKSYLTLWQGNENEKLLDTCLAKLDGSMENLVLITAIEGGYILLLNKLEGESYQSLWQSKPFAGEFYGAFAEDMNKDGLDELIIADSSGLKVCRWAEGDFKIDDYNLRLAKDSYLGVTNLSDKGVVLAVILENQLSYFRVGKTDIEEVYKEQLPFKAILAQTADVDQDGVNEIVIYHEKEGKGYLTIFKPSVSQLQIISEVELYELISSFTIGHLKGNKIGVICATKEGHIIISKLKGNQLLALGEMSFPDTETYQLLADSSSPGLVALRWAPSISKIKVVRSLKAFADKILVLTEKGKALLGKVPNFEDSIILKPLTFLDAAQQTSTIDINNVLQLSGELIDVKTDVAILEETVMEGSVKVKGKVMCKYLYRADGEIKISSGEEEFEFSTLLENPKLKENDWAQVTAEGCTTSIIARESKEYQIQTKADLDTKYYSRQEVNLLTGLEGIRQQSLEATFGVGEAGGHHQGHHHGHHGHHGHHHGGHCNDFVETTIQVESPIGRRRAQAVVKGTITTDVPIEKVLETNARVRDLRVQALTDQAIVRGVLEVDVLFVADTVAGDQPVFFTEGEIPFTVVISVPGLRPGMNVFVSPQIEFVKGIMVGPETIEVTAVLAFTAHATCLSPVDVIVDVNVNGNDIVSDVTFNQLEVDFPVGVCPINDVIARGENQALVEETVDIPPQKPDVEVVLSVDATVRIENIRVIPNKVVVRGVLRTITRYVADTLAGDQPVHAVSEDIHFTTFVDLPGVVPGTPVNVVPVLEYVKGRAADSREIDITAIVKVIATAFRPVRALVRA